MFDLIEYSLRQELERRMLHETLALSFSNAAAVSESLKQLASTSWKFSEQAASSLRDLFAAVVVGNIAQRNAAYGTLFCDADECHVELPKARTEFEPRLQEFVNQLLPSALAA